MTIGRKCSTTWKVSKYRVFSGPYLDTFQTVFFEDKSKNYKEKFKTKTKRRRKYITTQSFQNMVGRSYIPIHLFRNIQNAQPHKQSITTVLVVAVAVKMNNKKLGTKPKLRDISRTQ